MKFKGQVVHGDGRGRQIGYPTANLVIKEKLDIKEGVYSCLVRLNNKIYQGAMFYGKREMFGDIAAVLEVYILDFNNDIYGETLDVEVQSFIRGNMKFDSIDNLIKQIEADCLAVRKSLSS